MINIHFAITKLDIFLRWKNVQGILDDPKDFIYKRKARNARKRTEVANDSGYRKETNDDKMVNESKKR